MRHAMMNMIRRHIGADDWLDAQATFTELGIDSLDVLQIILQCEQRWDIRIPEHVYAHSKRMPIGEFIEHVLTYISHKEEP